jgi:hypothetical protein
MPERVFFEICHSLDKVTLGRSQKGNQTNAKIRYSVRNQVPGPPDHQLNMTHLPRHWFLISQWHVSHSKMEAHHNAPK